MFELPEFETMELRHGGYDALKETRDEPAKPETIDYSEIEEFI